MKLISIPILVICLSTANPIQPPYSVEKYDASFGQIVQQDSIPNNAQPPTFKKQSCVKETGPQKKSKKITAPQKSKTLLSFYKEYVIFVIRHII